MRAVALVLVLALTGCSASDGDAPAEPAIVGDWGGTEASLTITRAGGDLSLPCGAGVLDGNWTLGSDGRFAASGQEFFGGGPMPVQGRPPHPALYAGNVDGDNLVLTVTVTDLGQTIGPLHLVRGGPAVVERCV